MAKMSENEVFQLTQYLKTARIYAKNYVKDSKKPKEQRHYYMGRVDLLDQIFKRFLKEAE